MATSNRKEEKVKTASLPRARDSVKVTDGLVRKCQCVKVIDDKGTNVNMTT